MTWTRFESGARAHAKCVKAGNEAASFWAWAIMWSNDNGTDGYLDSSLLGAIPPVPIANDVAKALADKCVSARLKPGGIGLFEFAEGGYQIHDFHDFQPPAEEEKKHAWLSEVRAAAGRKGAAKRWQNIDGKTDGKSSSLAPARAPASVRVGSDREGEGGAGGSGVMPADPRSAETGYDLATRVWSELWAKRWGEPYVFSTNTGRLGDDRILQRLGACAEDHAEPETEFGRRLSRYLGDKRPWLLENRHPLRSFEADWNKYGKTAGADPEVDALRSRPTTPERHRFQTDVEIAERTRKLRGEAANG